jgi:carbonic anhydrase
MSAMILFKFNQGLLMPKSIENLIEGYKHFKEEYFNKNRNLFDNLITKGQRPKVLFVACSDSRVDPAIVTNATPGDLFVIRNVANLVPPYEDKDNASYHGTSAALEFGVCSLNIKHIVVFGHSKCGGMNSLFDNSNNNKGFIAKWMQIASVSRDFVNQNYSTLDDSDKSDLCGKYSLINSVNNLKTFPWIRSRLKDGRLNIHAWHFDIANGNISTLNAQNQFTSL